MSAGRAATAAWRQGGRPPGPSPWGRPHRPRSPTSRVRPRERDGGPPGQPLDPVAARHRHRRRSCGRGRRGHRRPLAPQRGRRERRVDRTHVAQSHAAALAPRILETQLFSARGRRVPGPDRATSSCASIQADAAAQRGLALRRSGRASGGRRDPGQAPGFRPIKTSLAARRQRLGRGPRGLRGPGGLRAGIAPGGTVRHRGEGAADRRLDARAAGATPRRGCTVGSEGRSAWSRRRWLSRRARSRRPFRPWAPARSERSRRSHLRGRDQRGGDAVPAARWRFAGWSGALAGAANPATLTMDGDKSVTATLHAGLLFAARRRRRARGA